MKMKKIKVKKGKRIGIKLPLSVGTLVAILTALGIWYFFGFKRLLLSFFLILLFGTLSAGITAWIKKYKNRREI